MKKITLITNTLILLFFLTSISLGLPTNFDWQNRPVPFRFTADELTLAQSKPVLKDNQELSCQSGRYKVQFVLEQSQVNISYAFHVQGDSCTVTINGRTVDSTPISGDDGKYIFIPRSYVVAGYNTLVISGSKSGVVPQLTAIELFGLIFTDEEVHFAQEFGGSVYRIMTQPASEPNQLKFDIQSVDLTHLITMSNTSIKANVTIISKCIDSTLSFQTAVFDLDDNSSRFSVYSVTRGYGTSTVKFTHNTSTNRLFIPLGSVLPLNSIFTVKIYYGGLPNASGTFGAPYRRETHGTPAIPIVSSFSEPYGARMWWPCKDTPDEKFTFTSHWTCPTTYTLVSNGKLVSRVVNGDGSHTYNFQEDYPICSYLVSVACTNYEYHYGIYTSQNGLSTMTVANYIYPENSASEGNGVVGTIALIDFFAETFGEYPFLREKYTTATHNDGSSMEHQTATSICPAGVSNNGDYRSNYHELAHQWFGDAITMQHFNHLWLNEGWATYCEALWKEHLYGIDTYHAYVNAWTTSDSYAIISNSADSFSGSIVYRKGGWVLHMLRHVVGDTTFFQATRNYMSDSTLVYGNALTVNFQNHFENVIGGSTSMAWFFNEWLTQANRPAYTVSWGSHLSGITTYADLRVTQTQTSATYVMPLDFKINFTDSSSTTVTVWNTQYARQDFHVPVGISKTVSGVVFDPDNWVLKTSNITHLKEWDNY